MTRDGMPGLRTFLASFLVLFLEVALIRWMPAYIRLLAYFSNFILLASFLGIGVGCLLASSRTRLFRWFPALQAAVILAVYYFRLEISVPTAGSIYFSSGTSDKSVVLVESTMLLPLLFVAVAALFVTMAQRMGKEMAALPPLRGYTLNIAGSLAGVAAFAVISWLQLSPAWWFGIAFISLSRCSSGVSPRPRRAPASTGQRQSLAGVTVSLALLAISLGLVQVMARGAIWSPYYKITVAKDGADTVVEVNNIFHQSMAPVEQKEYFYQWPVRRLRRRLRRRPDSRRRFRHRRGGRASARRQACGRGRNRSRNHRLGRERHPDRPYSDPRVTLVNDDARHYLRTTTKRYDLVVFALIDSLTMQSSFSGVRLESYMFTTESFTAVRDHLKPDGLLVVYNYFRERWLVDRLANTAAAAFGQEPRVHVHEARAYLGVMLAGPRLGRLTAEPYVPDRVTAFNQSHAPAPPRIHHRDPAIEPASDDWPFLYLRDRELPSHYSIALALILVVSTVVVLLTTRGQGGRWSWQFFLLGAGFMLLESKSIIQFALLWGSTWVVASLAIASVLTMALIANFIVSATEIRRPWLVGCALVALLVANFLIPIGRVGFESRGLESLFYAVLVFSPILCAGLLFGSAIKRSTSLARDYGTNLLGAMLGGVGEYLSLVTGFRVLLFLIAACYVGALLARGRERGSVARVGAIGESVVG